MLHQFHFRIQLTCRRHLYGVLILLGCILSFVMLTPCVHAQDGGPDPATSVEVTNATIWRDAVTMGSVTITCYDANGKPVPNDAVSISISSPGEICTPFGSTYTYSSSTTGTTDSNGTVTVTVKSTDFTLVGNDATATVTATADAASGTGSILFKGALEILCNNVVATNMTNSCNVGELELLQAKILSGVPCTATWTASGATPIGGWDGGSNPSATLTTPFPPGSLNGDKNAAQSLYLTTTGSDTATVNANDSAATATANTNFSVSVPACTFTAIQNKVTGGETPPSTGGVADGGGSLHGIDFKDGGGSGGTLELAQIINSVTRRINNSPYPVTGSFPALDTGFPYSSSMEDSPSWTITIQGTLTEMSESFNATMYLMWTSSKSGSIPIPVRSIGWNFTADLNFAAGNWNTQNPSTNGISLLSSPVAIGVLKWTNIVSGT